MLSTRAGTRLARVGNVFSGSRVGFCNIPGIVGNAVRSSERTLSFGSRPITAKHKALASSKRYLASTSVPEVGGLTSCEYQKISDATMDALYDALDAFAEENPNHDVEYAVSASTNHSRFRTCVLSSLHFLTSPPVLLTFLPFLLCLHDSVWS
jgi:hypothetical protein